MRRLRGYPLVQVVERWTPFARVRRDLFGCFDVLAVGPDRRTDDLRQQYGIARQEAAGVGGLLRKAFC